MGNEASTPIPYSAEVAWRKGGAPGAPPGREGHVAACWQNKLYIFGGGSTGGTQQSDLWSLDLASPVWRKLTPSGTAPSARTGACSAVVDGRMYVFDGMDMEQGFLDDVYCFNLADETWEQVEATGQGPTPRDKSAVCAVGKKLYLFGGFGPVEAEVELPEREADSEAEGRRASGEEDGEEEDDEEEDEQGPAFDFNWFDDLFVFDTESRQWERVEAQGQIPTARAAFAMDVVGDSIYVFGGRDTTKRQNDLYVFNTTTHTWSKPTVSGALPAERSFHTLTSLEPMGKSQLILFGGLSSSNQLLDDLHIFDVATNAWVQPMIKAGETRINGRRFHSAIAHDRSLVVFGGSSNFSSETQECLTFHNDVFVLDLAPVLDAAPVSLPPPSSAASAPVATSSSSSATTTTTTTTSESSSTSEDSGRGKKRKSEEIEQQQAAEGQTTEEPASNS